MIKTVMVCDCCKKEYDPKVKIKYKYIVKRNHSDEELDLCQTCNEAVYDLIYDLNVYKGTIPTEIKSNHLTVDELLEARGELYDLCFDPQTMTDDLDSIKEEIVKNPYGVIDMLMEMIKEYEEQLGL